MKRISLIVFRWKKLLMENPEPFIVVGSSPVRRGKVILSRKLLKNEIIPIFFIDI